MEFIRTCRAEWLKTKHSSISWLCLAGGAFIPLLYLVGFFKDYTSINAYPEGQYIWKVYFFQVWQFMAVFLLPLGVALAGSLIVQLEYRNNTWKQVHAAPLKFSTLYYSKFATLLVLTLKFFLFFNIGVVLSGTIPCLIIDHHWPRQGIPVTFFIKANARLFITCLPVITIQYVIGLNFKSFMVPVGFGIVMVLMTLMLFNRWQYTYLLPYSYSTFLIQGDAAFLKRINIYALASGYSLVALLTGYYLYVNRKEKS